jgi:hypothetical protein
MNPRCSTTLLLALLASAPLAGQEITSSSPPAHAPAHFELAAVASYSGRTRVQSGAARLGRVGVTRTATLAGASFDAGQNARLGLRLAYEYYALSLDEVTPLPSRLQGLGIGASYERRFSGDWILYTEAGASVRSTGTSLRSKGLGAEGVVVFGRQWTPALRAGVGVAFETLGSDVIPIIDLSWAITERLEFAIGYPRAGCSYRFDEATTLFVGAEGDFATFSFRPERGRPATAAIAANKLIYGEVRAGAAFRCEFGAGLAFEAFVGGTVYREFEYERLRYRVQAKEQAVCASATLSRRF